ncbi:MAG: serine/threonine protein kinase [bacterium]|nr:serine/threonine protein kinase [bacterium]
MSHPDFEYLGPYKVERTLGRGGMGSVYKGVHARSGEVVAIKVIAAGVANQPRFRRRFEAESQTLQRLKHPNIVSLKGVGEERGLLFYTMEYVDGDSLHDLLRKHKKLPYEDVVEIGIQTTAALKHAHDLGIIHRDLKPANLMIDRHGRVKLTDFGIAKLFGSEDMTAVGAVLGTADYMPPEQAEGKSVTVKSDLYSLGAVLYALVCGKPPFSGKSMPEVLYAVRYNPVTRLEELVPEVPRDLSELVHQLLEKEPSRRPPTAMVVGNRLKALQQGLKKLKQSRSDPADGTRVEATRVASELTSLDLSDVEDDELRLTHEEPLSQARTDDSLPLDVLGTHERQTALAADDLVESLLPSKIQEGNQPDAIAKAGSDLARKEAAKVVPLEDSESDEERMTVAGPSRYTPVTAAGESTFTLSEAHDEKPEHAWIQYVSVAGMLVLLAGAIGFGWWMLQPLPADRLYEEIMQASDSGDVGQLFTVKSEIDEFLKRFPDDKRSNEVLVLSEEMELARSSNNLQRKASRRGQQEMTAVEQAFLDCMQARSQDWQLAQAKLAAFVDVFGSLENLPRGEQKLVDLARYAMKQSESGIMADVSPAAKQLETVIRAAETSLSPVQLQAYYRDVLLLYADKPWAAEQIKRIRDKLTES